MTDKDKELVKSSIDKVADLVAQGSFNKLAGRLDVSKQARSKWRTEGKVPPQRACQMEVLTSGKVKWWQLAPQILHEVNEV